MRNVIFVLLFAAIAIGSSGCGLSVSRAVEPIAVIVNHSNRQVTVDDGRQKAVMKPSSQHQLFADSALIFQRDDGQQFFCDLHTAPYRDCASVNDSVWSYTIYVEYRIEITDEAIYVITKENKRVVIHKF